MVVGKVVVWGLGAELTVENALVDKGARREEVRGGRGVCWEVIRRTIVCCVCLGVGGGGGRSWLGGSAMDGFFYFNVTRLLIPYHSYKQNHFLRLNSLRVLCESRLYGGEVARSRLLFTQSYGSVLPKVAKHSM